MARRPSRLGVSEKILWVKRRIEKYLGKKFLKRWKRFLGPINAVTD
jgi:hypothetical protein